MGSTTNSNTEEEKKSTEAEQKGFTRTCYYDLLGVERDCDLKAI